MKTEPIARNSLSLLRVGECMIVTPEQGEACLTEALQKGISIRTSRCHIAATLTGGKVGMQREMTKVYMPKRDLPLDAYQFAQCAKRRHAIQGFNYPHVFTKGLETTGVYRNGIVSNFVADQEDIKVKTDTVMIYDADLSCMYTGYVITVSPK